MQLEHIVQFGKFHRIGGAQPETFHNVKYGAPEDMAGDGSFAAPRWRCIYL